MPADISPLLLQLAGFSSHTASLFRGEQEAFAHVLLQTYFSKTLEEGKNHFAFIGHFKKIPFYDELENAYISLRRYDIEEVDDFAAEIFGPKTALVILAAADPFTGRIYPLDPIIQQAKDAGVSIHIDASTAIQVEDYAFCQHAVDSLHFSFTRLQDAPIGSCLLHKSSSSLPDAPLGEDFLDQLKSAAKKAVENKDSRILSFARKKQYLLQLLKKQGIEFAQNKSLADRLCLSFPKVYGESLAFRLEGDSFLLQHHPTQVEEVGLQLEERLEKSDLEQIVERLSQEIIALLTMGKMD